MVAAFSNIFLGSHLSCTFMAHVPIIRDSWKVTLIIRIYIWSVLSLSEEVFLLELPPYLYPAPYVLSLNHLLPFGRPRTTHALGQGPRPNCIIWAHDPIRWKYSNKSIVIHQITNLSDVYGMDKTNSTIHANVSMFWSHHKEKKKRKIYDLNLRD